MYVAPVGVSVQYHLYTDICWGSFTIVNLYQCVQSAPIVTLRPSPESDKYHEMFQAEGLLIYMVHSDNTITAIVINFCNVFVQFVLKYTYAVEIMTPLHLLSTDR